MGGLEIRAEILTDVRYAFAEARLVIPTPSGEVTLPRPESRTTLAAPR
jgi:hypothetical protein